VKFNGDFVPRRFNQFAHERDDLSTASVEESETRGLAHLSDLKREMRNNRAAPPLGFFERRARQSREAHGLILFSEVKCRALVEILVSHLSAKSAERWGTRLLGEGEIEWAGILGNARSLDCDRDDRFLGGNRLGRPSSRAERPAPHWRFVLV
jgi:hypothetical protein